MRTKTFLELMALSTNLYVIAKDQKVMEKLHEYAEKGKDKVNNFVKEKITDEVGNELEFVDKMLHKFHEAKDELESKIEEVVSATYKKMHIANTDQIKNLEEKIEALSKELSLANKKIKGLENK